MAGDVVVVVVATLRVDGGRDVFDCCCCWLINFVGWFMLGFVTNVNEFVSYWLMFLILIGVAVLIMLLFSFLNNFFDSV